MKVAFGKSFDLILQICHLLIIVSSPGMNVSRTAVFALGQKYATMNYNIVLSLLAMGY